MLKVRKQKQMKLSKWAEQARKELPAVKAKFGPLFDEVSAILFRHDPMHINYGSNTDEYDPEVGTILPRLKQCRSARDVQESSMRSARAGLRYPESRRNTACPARRSGRLGSATRKPSSRAWKYCSFVIRGCKPKPPKIP